MKDTQVILEIIKELRADASLNYKKEVLARYSDYEPFREFLIRVYNPRINYYMKKIPDVISYGMKEQSTYELHITLDTLVARGVVGNDAITYVRNFLLEANQTVRELFELTIGRDIRAGVGVGIINEVYRGLIEEIFYCRCSKLDEKALERFDSMPDGFLAQMKADGIFSYIIIQDGEVSFLTRAGTPWTSNKLSEELKHLPNCVLIGEALIIDAVKVYDRKTGNGMITSYIKREATLESLQKKVDSAKTQPQFAKSILDQQLRVHKFNTIDGMLNFQVWDSLTLEEFENGLSPRPYTERFGEAIRLSFMTQSLRPIPSFRVYSMKEAQTIADEYISEGFEGAVVKKLDAIWQDGTSKDMVKIKEVYDADLYCVGIKLGKGKYEGKIGSLILQTSCGRIEVDCGSGLTDLDRKKSPDEFIGKIIEIQYNKFIQSKKDKPASLYLPRFVEVREDKNTATSYEEIVG